MSAAAEAYLREGLIVNKKQFDEFMAMPIYGNHYSDSELIRLAEAIIMNTLAPMVWKIKALQRIFDAVGHEEEVTEEIVIEYIHATENDS